jgi:hypothetical protein
MLGKFSSLSGLDLTFRCKRNQNTDHNRPRQGLSPVRTVGEPYQHKDGIDPQPLSLIGIWDSNSWHGHMFCIPSGAHCQA